MTNEVAATAEPAGSESPVAKKRDWSLPKSPVNRQQVDQMARTAVAATGKTAAALGAAIAAVARYTAGVAAQIGRAFAAIPAALQWILATAGLMLAGIAGTIAFTGTAAVLCAVVLVPVAAIALGALGHRWFAETQAAPISGAAASARETSDLAHSVLYVDKKLTLALNALGTDRHQQAVIALFQAKTAVDLALGTEDDSEPVNPPVRVDAYRLRPRIQAGSSSKSAIAESNSLAAS
ncbi:hypothetical protein ACQI4F_18265 [Mycolicibacterium vaccae]|uniref:hypothetical protein n=1 Tax=Mycolicibacterium vaccae TaxID=1810 RepID=UPI003CFB1EF0